MDVMVYASDMGSQDPRLEDMRVGEEYVLWHSRSWSSIMCGYEYKTLRRVSDGRFFRVRAEKVAEHFDLKNDSSL